MFKDNKWVRFLRLFTAFVAVLSFALVAFLPSAEARISFREQIKQDFKDNVIRTIDRIQRAYEDDYVESTRDRLRIKRYARNDMLREVYAAKYEAKYRPEINRYTNRSSESSGVEALSPKDRIIFNKICQHLESGEVIRPNDFYERYTIIELCDKYGIPYRIEANLIYVSK